MNQQSIGNDGQDNGDHFSPTHAWFPKDLSTLSRLFKGEDQYETPKYPKDQSPPQRNEAGPWIEKGPRAEPKGLDTDCQGNANPEKGTYPIIFCHGGLPFFHHRGYCRMIFLYY